MTVQAKAQVKISVKAPRKPTRLERAIQRQAARAGQAVRRPATRAGQAVAPYAAAGGAGMLTGAALHSPLLAGVSLGAAATHAGIRSWEEWGWHRNGGKAAIRRRRKYQGTATRRELRAKLSPAAARKHTARISPDLDPAFAPVIIGRRGRQTVAGSRADSYLVIAPPQTMKALALDTPVPTPGGWTTMGALREGDVIFGSDGKPTTVLGAWPVRYDRPCYELEFSDGTVITADAEHLWLVDTRASRMSVSGQRKYKHNTPSKSQQHKRRMPQVLTTAMMAGNFRTDCDNRANYSVRMAAPLALPEADLPVPPYTLGAWLGDGHAHGARITTTDPEIIAAIEAEGQTCKQEVSPSAQLRCPTYRIMGIQSRLRGLGVLKNKHIPPIYLRASEEQRRALLAGLLDTDGCCQRTGVYFQVTNERLARDVKHLAATLGYKAKLSSWPAKLRGKDCGTSWNVHISCENDVLFRLSRKAIPQAKLGTGRAGVRMRQRYIVDIRRVPSVPVRCITVDSPDSLYLVSEACIPTHNTGLISCWAADAPGALLATSSRGDLYRHTAVPRSALGDVWVLNADGDRAIPANLAWSPVAGCRNPQTAIRRAGDLMHASPRDSSGKDAWHEERGAKLLRYMLHAAAVAGASMHEVAAWVHDPLSMEPMSILESRGAEPGWAGKLAALTAHDGDYLSGVISSAEAAIGWMDDPVLAAIATPADGGLDIRQLIASGTGSIYLIGEERPHGSLGPYFSAFTAEAFHAAKDVAENSGGRLRIPFTMALDEAGTIIRTPLHKWSAVAAGYNITLKAGIQAKSQLDACWGEHDAKTIWSNFTTKIIGGGFTDPAELEQLSAVCGDQDTWHHVKHPDGSKTKQPDKERLFPPERIRMLPAWHALVLHRNTRPAEVTVTPVWDRPGYQPAPPYRARAQQAAERPALEAPPRAAIPMPAGTLSPLNGSTGTAGSPVIIPDKTEEALTR